MFSRKSARDGRRISVMSRHTLNDGITPDKRIKPGSYHGWEKKLAPPDRLVGSWYKRDLQWEKFEEGYLNHLRTPAISAVVESLARRALEEDVTVLCAETKPERCHRKILAEECKRKEPKLIVVVS